MKSVQARILSGLGFSLTVFGLTMVTFMVPLTLISTWATAFEDNIRRNLNEALIKEVNRVLQKDQIQDLNQNQTLIFTEAIENFEVLNREIRTLISQSPDKIDAGSEIQPTQLDQLGLQYLPNILEKLNKNANLFKLSKRLSLLIH